MHVYSINPNVHLYPEILQPWFTIIIPTFSKYYVTTFSNFYIPTPLKPRDQQCKTYILPTVLLMSLREVV